MHKKDVKCVVWDLDNTLWQGVLLEDKNVLLKPKIAEIIQEIDRRGILNAIASKNNHDDAVQKLKEFSLYEYFLYPEINWNAKSQSISNIQKNLNIGMDTMIFIDDQPFERDEVSAVHQDIATFDADDYLKLLEHTGMNPRFVTQDSNNRRKMYQDDIKRRVEEGEYKGPQEKFLASLNMKFKIHEATEEDLKRAEELTVRTNQLNSTGQTYDFDKLNQFRTSDKYKLYVCELSDKYGTYGKIGLLLVEIKKTHWHLKLLLMSCRVMSRGVGSVLMSFIKQECKKADKKLLADFQKTDKNRMMYITYKFENFKELESDENGYVLFENDLSMIQPFPNYIEVNF